MGGSELLPEEMLPNEGALKAWANEGRDCGMCVAMLPWLTAIWVGKRTQREEMGTKGKVGKKKEASRKRTTMEFDEDVDGQLDGEESWVQPANKALVPQK
jgi:hypothetical protein